VTKTVTDDHAVYIDRTVGDAPSKVCLTACSMDEYGGEKRTEKNFILRSGISEAATIIKDCARRFVLKLYRHKASRSLFATAELLAESVLMLFAKTYQN